MKISEIVTRNLETTHANDPVEKAARIMKDFNVGAVPVFEGDNAIGILTDRDIAIRVVAEGKDINTRVKEIMTSGIIACPEHADAIEALQMMEQKKVRRLLVKNDRNAIVGVVSLGDIAVKLGKDAAGEALREISKPAEPER